MELRNRCLGDDRIIRQSILVLATKQWIVFRRSSGEQDASKVQVLGAGEVFGRNIIKIGKAQLLFNGNYRMADIALDIKTVEGRQPPSPVSHIILVKDNSRELIDVSPHSKQQVANVVYLAVARCAVVMRIRREQIGRTES